MNIHFINNETFGIPIPEGFTHTDMVDASAVVVCGGDGTILRAFKTMVSYNMLSIPLFGINKGTVGFMSNDINPEQYNNLGILLTNLIERYKDEFCEERSLLNITMGRRRYKALNEITVHPKNLGRLLVVDADISLSRRMRKSVSMKGDGVIVSTPTGSTAYNLSAGGPILMPDMEAMVLTPMNPFTMSARTVILNKDDNILLNVHDECRVVIDGVEVEGSSNINVSLSSEKLELLRISPFFDAIQSKLGWNSSIK